MNQAAQIFPTSSTPSVSDDARMPFDSHPCFHKGTGDITGHSDITPASDFGAIVTAARRAQKYWAEVPVKERAAIIRRAGVHIARHCDRFAETISVDNGKTRVDALITELIPSAMAASYYARKAPSFLKDRYLSPGHMLMANKVSKIVRAPLGVIGIISPWNYPFAIPFSEVVMGLLAGNAVILKVASETQLVAGLLKETFEAVGLPYFLFNIVNMDGPVAGDAFLESGIDKLFFTGSVRVGKILMKKAAETLTPVSLELGGNDAMLVCEDADLDRAAAGAVWAGFQNAGQSCGGVERIYVHEAVYQPFLEKLKAKTEALQVGFDTDFHTDIGVMTTDRQVATVRDHIEDALARGAKVAATAKPAGNGDWSNMVLPQVFTDVDHSMKMMREETFGPVIGVMAVRDMDEAVALANDSDLGLSASVWSGRRGKAMAIGRRIRAGAVMVNDHLMSHGLAETPWGGFKESGIGRTHGDIGFAEMTEPQVIVNDILPFVRKNMWWHPHGPEVYTGLKGLLEGLYGDGIKARVKGFSRMLWLYRRTFSRK